MAEIRCGGCWAHYQNGTLHVCDPLMKRLVDNKRKNVEKDALSLKQYTLFMSVSSFLEIEKWNRSDGELNVGDEVTVNGERYIGNNKVHHNNAELLWSAGWEAGGHKFGFSECNQPSQRNQYSLRFCQKHHLHRISRKWIYTGIDVPV